jgi:hypothetical protein
MKTWSKEFSLEFIEVFRGYLCIWKVKSKEYHNREMKESAYSALTEKVILFILQDTHTIAAYANSSSTVEMF